MNNNIYGLAIVLLAMIIVNRLMAIPHAKKLNKQLQDIKKKGPISSVGLAKHWSGNRAYVLVTDLEGNILEGYATKGNTVFSGFKKDEKLEEKTYKEIIESLSAKKKLNCMQRAKKMAAEYLKNGLEKEAIEDNAE